MIFDSPGQQFLWDYLACFKTRVNFLHSSNENADLNEKKYTSSVDKFLGKWFLEKPYLSKDDNSSDFMLEFKDCLDCHKDFLDNLKTENKDYYREQSKKTQRKFIEKWSPKKGEKLSNIQCYFFRDCSNNDTHKKE